MYDILVIGGGVNGVAIARDAAGRGLKVLLCEKDDLAAHTSSSSTKLIHGGLRYLEHYEFKLVRESLIEREILLRAAPHIIRPMRFILPYDAGLRPAIMLRTGLFLYDHIGGRKILPKTTKADLTTGPNAHVLQDRLTFGYEYSDCWVEDARLVVLNAIDAEERGAEILTHTACTSLTRSGDHWNATLNSGVGGQRDISAKIIVNAAGPWVDDILDKIYPQRQQHNVRLVKGSHIVTKKLYDGDHCYIFQNADNRIIFAIPYEGDYTLVGTTDQSFSGDQNMVEISPEEITYLCDAASEYFTKPVTKNDIVWTYAGVRPLYDDHKSDNSTVTRDYVFDLDGGPENGEDQPVVLSIFGGKLTTHRKLAEHAMAKLADHLQINAPAWTKNAHLPGGDIDNADFDGFLAQMTEQYSWIPKKTRLRLARYYGTRLPRLIGDAKSIADLGIDFGAGLYQAEITYLMTHEYATTAQDILWRRTKLGLHMDHTQKARIADWIAQQ